MTSWIIVVGDGFEGNWERAVDFQLWDLKKRRKIKRGDDVYFWQAPNKGFRGWARAVSNAADGTPEPRPWIPKDTTTYVQRFYLEVVSNTFISGKWGTFFDKTTVTAGPNTAPIEVSNPADEALLQSLFLPALGISKVGAGTDLETSPLGMEVDLDKYASFLSPDDLRKLKDRMIAVREGQPAFRAALIAAYGGRCAVSGTSVIRVLEAAHISPYRGVHSNKVTNGLLLRSDLHRLFDSRLLAISEGGTVLLAPLLRDSEYQALHGADLHLPDDTEARPNAAALKVHRERCEWI
jgi:hypothetical protein